MHLVKVEEKKKESKLQIKIEPASRRAEGVLEWTSYLIISALWIL